LRLKIYRESLVEDDGDVARAQTHFTRGPGRNCGNNGMKNCLDGCDDAIIAGNFLEPRARSLQARADLVAKSHELGEISRCDGTSVEADDRGQGIGKRLARRRDPDRAPMVQREPREGDSREHEYEHGEHSQIFQFSVWGTQARRTMALTYHVDGTRPNRAATRLLVTA